MKQAGTANKLGVAAVLVLAAMVSACAPTVQLAVAPDIQSAAWATQYAGSELAVGTQPDVGHAISDPPHSAGFDWAAFGSRELNGLLNQARAANTDIAIANTRIAKAAADLRIARAANGPVLEAFGRTESNSRGGSGDNAFRDSYIAGDLDLTYIIDLSGRLKAGKKTAFARYLGAVYEAQATRLNIEAAVASSYIEYAALCDRIEIAEQALANAREFERTLGLRAAEGVTSQVDAGLQATEANSLAVDLSKLREARVRTVNALAVLVGEEAPLFSLQPASLSELTTPRFTPLQPAALVTRRLDMLAAAAMIEAAEGDVQRARAAFIPDIEVSAGAFLDSAATNGLLSPGFALASRVMATIFDNGRLKGQVYRARAEQTEAVEQYRKTLLSALASAQNALVGSTAASERAALLRRSQQIAARTADLARRRFTEGNDDFSTVLIAERRSLEVADSYVVARQDALGNAIALYTAMGGRLQ